MEYSQWQCFLQQGPLHYKLTDRKNGPQFQGFGATLAPLAKTW
jgi:hypothetical protein